MKTRIAKKVNKNPARYSGYQVKNAETAAARRLKRAKSDE